MSWLFMAEGEEYLMRPVDAGLCKYESLIGTDLDLADFARMNDWLDVKTENEKRYRKANEE